MLYHVKVLAKLLHVIQVIT